MKRLAVFLLSVLSFACCVQAAEDLPDDERLVTRISSAFADNAEYADALVQVHSERGFILLTGQVTSEAARNGATNTVVFASQEIRRIINELAVVDVVDRSTAEADAALLGTVEAALQELDASLAEKTLVVVHRAQVYLLGAMTSEEQSQVAKRVASIPGVAGIRTAFEVL